MKTYYLDKRVLTETNIPSDFLAQKDSINLNKFIEMVTTSMEVKSYLYLTTTLVPNDVAVTAEDYTEFLVAPSNGTLEEVIVSTATAGDNGTTTFNIFKNDVSVGVIEIKGTATSESLTLAEPIEKGDRLSFSTTTVAEIAPLGLSLTTTISK